MLINEIINDEGVYRTALVTPGLLTTLIGISKLESYGGCANFYYNHECTQPIFALNTREIS